MLTAARALVLNSQSSPELPRVPALEALYQIGVRPRAGEVIMIAGRAGHQKSGFALWWVLNMGLPTLYLSADMSAFQASVRIASSISTQTTEEVEAGMTTEAGRQAYIDAMRNIPITFSFGSPITWSALDVELDAYVELHNAYPEIIVVDNLMDVDGSSSDYTAQMESMQNLSDLSRATGCTVIVLHHASDKGENAKKNPWQPPPREEIKGGMSEKPELALSVAYDGHSGLYRIACIKQRMGPSDQTGMTYATLRAEPEYTQFHAQSFTRQEIHP